MATSSERRCFLEVGSTDDGDITLYPLHLLSRSSFCTHLKPHIDTLFLDFGSPQGLGRSWTSVPAIPTTILYACSLEIYVTYRSKLMRSRRASLVRV